MKFTDKKTVEGLYVLLDSNGVLIDFDKNKDNLEKYKKNNSICNHEWHIYQLNDIELRKKIKEYL